MTLPALTCMERESVTRQRYLIVNADDFGQSPGVNDGVIEGHEHGIITSASLMVRWDAAQQAAAYARENPDLSVGLHLDVGEWSYREDKWEPLYEVVREHDGQTLQQEIGRQLNAFRRLLGRDPTHLDSHQHVHREEPLRSLMVNLAAELNVPLRHFCPHVTYCGAFYGQTASGEPLPECIAADHLMSLLASLLASCTELGCHPAQRPDMISMYRDERVQELAVLCDPRLHETLLAQKIELISFQDLRELGPEHLTFSDLDL